MIRQLLLPVYLIAASVALALPHLTTLPPVVTDQSPATGAFVLFDADGTAPFVSDPGDYPGVLRAVRDLREDLASVGAPAAERSARRPILVGTLGRSPMIDALAAAGKLDVSDLRGKWESFVIVTLERPTPDFEQALVVVGSDKRGTIYGLYELSEQLGVSPWHWWADVPPRRRAAAHVAPGRHLSGEPVVKYRGIFLNDEAPALTN